MVHLSKSGRFLKHKARKCEKHLVSAPGVAMTSRVQAGKIHELTGSHVKDVEACRVGHDVESA
jgi:hypothetical protein